MTDRRFRRSTRAQCHRFPLLGLLLLALPAWGRDSVHHQLKVRLEPERGVISVEDRLALPPGSKEWILTLHRDLNPKVPDDSADLTSVAIQGHLEQFRLRARETTATVTLAYSGKIHHGLNQIQESPGRSREWTQGMISTEGVFLDAGSGWYPHLSGSLQTFEMIVALPAGWLAVSQGQGPQTVSSPEGATVRWHESQPQDDIYLMAGAFDFYERPTAIASAQAYLRQPDDELANRYLEATARYLELYSKLIGPYPYAKFALVENFWATGYGMPSFTVLGPEVIRLPFIPFTSYPHEVLHNWWGNGVYVDLQTGNWSEGLTTYLADHLLKEQAGQGSGYRRDTLQSYWTYVREETDFPLTEFRGRHSAASQAVGYGKTLMFFHMLRRTLGDEDFVAGLRQFYVGNRFRSAGFDDLRRAFEEVSGKNLDPFFRQWTTRTGGPELRLDEVRVAPSDAGYRVTGRLRQTQNAPPYQLAVPVVVHLKGAPAVETRIEMAGESVDFSLEVEGEPLQLAVDPRFDLFRSLAEGESPPTLSALFGSGAGLIVLPTSAEGSLIEAYRDLARTWTNGYEGWDVTTDALLAELPEDRPVWILGWENRFLRGAFQASQPFSVSAQSRSVELPEGKFQGAEASIALVADRGQSPPLAWLGAHAAAATPGLARKLPHYGKYGYLVFTGDAPTNTVKGQWPPNRSALRLRFSGNEASLEPPVETPLTLVISEPRGAD